MHNATLLTSAFFLALFAAGCKDDTPQNEPGEFGEPCVIGEANDTPDGCASGKCYFGYCEEFCAVLEDCQPVEGWERSCAAGLCHIVCDADNACPQDLGTAMTCNASHWCEAKDFK